MKPVFSPSVVIAFLVTLAFLAANGWFSARAIRVVEQADNEVIRTAQILTAISRLRAALVDAETGQRGYLITSAGRYLEPYHAALKNIHAQLTELRILTSDNAQQQGRLAELELLIQDKLAELGETIRLHDETGVAAAAAVVASDRGKLLMDEIRDLLRQVRQTEQGLLEARQRESEREVGRIRLAFFFSIAINASLLVAAFVTVLRDAARRRDTAEALLSRKQELERLVEARTAELSALAAHVEKVQEEEKASFARELHDDFGSALTVIKIDLASIRRKMSADPLIEKKLDKTSAVVDSCVETQRRLIQKLRPTILDDLGIGAALAGQRICHAHEHRVRRTAI